MAKTRLFIAAMFIISNFLLTAQVSITTDGSSPDSSAMLDVKSTEKGMLIPRMTELQRDGISTPSKGLLIFQSDGTQGYYYYTGTHWSGLVSNGSGTSSSLIDSDGNIYATITIGKQVWMAENLQVTHYRNGDPIPHVTNGGAWSGLTTGAYCWYNNNQPVNENYGVLYNWYTVNDSRRLCPEGWHVPTDIELTTLTTYLGGTSVAGGKMKATSNLWNTPNTNATNASYFSGLPSGYRINDGVFNNIGYVGYWWSSTEESSDFAWYYNLNYLNGNVYELTNRKQTGFCVRCLRD